MKKLFPLILSIFLLGCSTTTYMLGYHYLGEEDILTSVVSQKTDDLSKPFEVKGVQLLIAGDMDSFKGLFTDKLLKAVPADAYMKVKNAIQLRYTLNGRYERLAIADVHRQFDTAAFLNGFDHYDYIEAKYVLHGESSAVVHLYITRIGENLVLSGFWIHDTASNMQEARFSIKYLIPETIDKAGLIGRGVIKLPK